PDPSPQSSQTLLWSATSPTVVIDESKVNRRDPYGNESQQAAPDSSKALPVLYRLRPIVGRFPSDRDKQFWQLRRYRRRIFLFLNGKRELDRQPSSAANYFV